MTNFASDDQTSAGIVSSHMEQHAHRDVEQQGTVHQGMELNRIEYATYATPQMPVGLVDLNREGGKTFSLEAPKS